MRKSLGKEVFKIGQPDAIELTPEQRQILDTEPVEVAYQKFMEMGFKDFSIAEHVYDNESVNPFTRGTQNVDGAQRQ